MAYTNFITCTKEEYEKQIYSGDSRHRLRIWFNEIELENADVYCEKLTIKPRIIPNGSKVFSLDNFVSTEATLIIHDLDLSTVVSPVRMSIGTLVGDTYEDVPIGTFIIQDKPTTDKGKTTIKLLDNANKFDFNYDGKELIDANDGSATKTQIFRDICSKAGIETDVETFYGETDILGTYDNTIKARTYISYLAEQSGAVAKINRDGKLIFVYLNDLRTQRIPLSLVEKYTNADPYTISKVVYEDGIRKFEAGEDTADKLFINMSNPYISSQEQIDNIYSIVNGFTINSFTTGKIIGNPAIDPYDIIEIYDDYDENEPVIARTLATYTLTYNGVIVNTYDTQIGLEERKENMTIKSDDVASLRKFVNSSIDEVNATITLVSGQVDENTEQISQFQNSIDGININITDIEKDVSSLENNLDITASGLEMKITKTGNNLLMGTSFYDLSQWGLSGYYYIYEDKQPPIGDKYQYWYNTENGIIYEETEGGYWKETELLRKDIAEQNQYNEAIIVDNEWSKTNFLSQRAIDVKLSSIKPTIIDNTQDFLTFSFKVQNSLREGYFLIQLYCLVDLYPSINQTDNIVLTYDIKINAGEMTELQKVQYTFPILTNKDVVVAYQGSSEPTTGNYNYWLGDKLYQLINGEWKEVETAKIIYAENTGIYYTPFYDAETKKYLYSYNMSYQENDYDTKSLWGVIRCFDKDGMSDNIKGNVIIGDIKLEYGTSATEWSLNENESYGKNYKLDDKGFAISKGDYEMFIDEDEVTGYYKERRVFQLNQYNTYSKRGVFDETDQNGLITKKLSNGKYVRYIKEV